MDSTSGTLNGEPYTLTVAPRNRDGSVFVPIRFVGEASQYVVTWVNSTKTIHLVPTRTLVSSDGLSKLTVGGNWLSKTSPAIIDSGLYLENGINALFTTTESKADLDNIKTLEEYEKAVMKNIDPQLVTSLSDVKKLKINGLDARQISYSFKASNDVNYSYLQTFIEGKYSYYRVILLSRDAINSELKSDYQTTVQTFEEIRTPGQLSKEKFGALTSKDRYLDAAHYYRDLGFFNSDKTMTSQEFDNKLMDIYSKLKDWNPFDSTKYYDEFAELYMLELDYDRVWLEDIEADVAKGNNVYVAAFEKVE